MLVLLTVTFGQSSSMPLVRFCSLAVSVIEQSILEGILHFQLSPCLSSVYGKYLFLLLFAEIEVAVYCVTLLLISCLYKHAYQIQF